MIALRLLSLLAGGLVLVLPAAVLSDAGVSGMTALAAVIGLAVMSGIFVYIGVAGARMRRSNRARTLGAALLAVPILGSLGLLASRKDAELLWCSGALLIVSLVVFMGLVFPVLERRQRPMRRRERQDPVLLKLQ
jgi:hypothetical protein